MQTFSLEIITPSRSVFDDSVEAVFVPTIDGLIGVLPHHVPLFTALVEGEVKITQGTKEMYLAIGGGFMEVTKDKVSILVSRAAHADELNEAEINKAYASAKEMLANKGKGKEFSEAQAILRRSILEMRMISKVKHRSMPLRS